MIHGLDAVMAREKEAGGALARLASLQNVSLYDVLADKFDAGLSFDQIAARRGVDPLLLPLVFATAGDMLGDFKKRYDLGLELAWLPLIEFKPLAQDGTLVDVASSEDSPRVVLTVGPSNCVGTTRRHEIAVGSAAARSVLAGLLERLSSPEVVVDAPEALLGDREANMMIPIAFQGTIVASHRSGDTGRGDMWLDTVEFTISEAEAANLKVEWLTVDRRFHSQQHIMNLRMRSLRLPEPTRAQVHGIMLPPDRLAITAADPVEGEGPGR